MSVNTKWAIDPAHSEIGFKVKHMMFTNVSGKFTSFNTNIETVEDDFSQSRIRFEADVNSVSTGNADRDSHLLGADFLMQPNTLKSRSKESLLRRLMMVTMNLQAT